MSQLSALFQWSSLALRKLFQNISRPNIDYYCCSFNTLAPALNYNFYPSVFYLFFNCRNYLLNIPLYNPYDSDSILNSQCALADPNCHANG